MGILLSGERATTTDVLLERASRVASGFAELGVGAGDAVALFLRNDFAFLEASLGAARCGAYCVAVNWHAAPAEARYVFEDSAARVVVIHADLLERVREALPAGVPVRVVRTPPEVLAAYGIDPARAAVPAGETDWDAWVDARPPHAAPPVPAPDVMLYTSGTTGRPKGVRRRAPTPGQVALVQRIRARGFGFPEDGRFTTVIPGPMYHSAPNGYAMLAARLGADVILQPRFDAEGLLRLIERHRVTHLQMVPVMFNRLLDLPEAVRTRYDLSSLRFVVHSAAPVSPGTKRRMIEWWGPIVREYYGTTETSMITFCDTAEWLAHPGTVGRPLPEVDLAILDDDGRPLPPGQVGRIAAWTRGAADFTYQNDDEKRRRAFVDGRFVTGDVGRLDADGFLHLLDRSNDMVISGGVNIYPAEIEAELCAMPGVADCAVFGIPDAEFGEALCAVVQPAPGAARDADAVRAWLRGRLAGYKVPRRVEFADDLPREDSGKIFKRRLREPYWAEAGRRI